ncbi:hypothetical protein [Pseudomonas sp. RA_105y_Pfl2_P56]|uniref:hypothetical protein n=1 Tax=Pseudomonas sp. RA_105y_Pfl2_P56 TaxID=3088701 RepID=UPI0030D9D483
MTPLSVVVEDLAYVAVPDAMSGAKTACFIRPNCSGQILKDSVFPFSFSIYVTAGRATGFYARTVSLFARSNEDGIGESTKIAEVMYAYTVVNPTCSIGSATSLELQFGRLSSNDVDFVRRTANIDINCLAGVQATAQLVPTQKAIRTGISATTLDGLSMGATWVDNGQAVDFNTARRFTLLKGNNLIRLNFRPTVNAGASPVGEFSSQYTLNLTYP